MQTRRSGLGTFICNREADKEQGFPLARPLASQVWVQAHQQALAGVVQAADLGHLVRDQFAGPQRGRLIRPRRSEQGADRVCLQGRDPAQPGRLEILPKARCGQHAAVTHQCRGIKAETLPDLGHPGGCRPHRLRTCWRCSALTCRWRAPTTIAATSPRGEDSSGIRTGHGLSTATALNNLALALLLSQRPDDTVPNAQTYYVGNRDEALQLLLNPGQRGFRPAAPESGPSRHGGRPPLRLVAAAGAPCSALPRSQRSQHRNKTQFSVEIGHSFRVPTPDSPPYPPSSRLRISGGR